MINNYFLGVIVFRPQPSDFQNEISHDSIFSYFSRAAPLYSNTGLNI